MMKTEKGEVKFLLSTLFKVIFLVIKIPLLLCLLVITFFFTNSLYKKVMDTLKRDLSGLLVVPLEWFFLYRATLFLCFVLIIVFLLQFFYFDNFGEAYASYPSDVFDGSFYRLLTSIFFHGSLGHLVGNLVALFVFGRKVEKYLGWKVIPLFLASGVMANLVSGFIYYYVFNSNVPGWGASGAIAGLIMLSILMDPFSLTFIFSVPLPTFIVGWFFIYYDFISRNLDDGIGHYVHLGGYFGVLLLTIFFEREKKRKLLKGIVVNIVMLGLLFVLGVLQRIVQLG